MINISKFCRFFIYTNCPILRYGFVNNGCAIGFDFASVYVRFVYDLSALKE